MYNYLIKCFLFTLSDGFYNRNKNQCSRDEYREYQRTVNPFAPYKNKIANAYPKQGENDGLCKIKWFSHCFFFFSTIASMTATAVMFTMSRTDASQSVKWIGLFNPI